MIDTSRRAPLEKTYFPFCHRVSITGSFLIQTQIPCLLPLIAETPPGLNLYRSWVWCHSFCEFICVSGLLHLEGKTWYAWSHSSPLALMGCLLLLHLSLDLRGGFWWKHLIWDWVLQSLSLNIVQLWISVNSHLLPEASQVYTKALTSVYSSMSLGVILLLCSFNRITVLDFPQACDLASLRSWPL